MKCELCGSPVKLSEGTTKFYIPELTDEKMVAIQKMVEALKNAECLCMTIEERCSDGDIASVSRNFYIPIFEEALEAWQRANGEKE